MFPDDEDVKAVAKAMFDPFEYLVLRHKDGLLKTDFRNPLGRVSYHVPCHLRVQNMGQKTRELLEMIPDTLVTTVERCSGHDGTWGVKSEYFEQSMKIGRPVFGRWRKQTRTTSAPTAPSPRARSSRAWAGRKRHPISLMRIAYGI